ncbi:MAG: acyl-CoA dehydrogenase [Gammaproteobacteria bacterium]|nr:MAG: acyl-CoA dehydrogenase [Gammaproteobacteria bacterium]
MTDIDLDHLKQWEGKQETHEDVISLATAQAMAATLDWEALPQAGDELAKSWHWLHFLATARQSKIGRDGHPERGGFLPPVPLPRRMWASGQAAFHSPLHIGDNVRKVSTVKSVTHKQGGTGNLVFVVVEHEIYTGDTLAISDTQNLVYREDPDPNAPSPKAMLPKDTAGFSREVNPDPVLLFRFSALTFNGHRIHYDRDYAMNEEGYTGLVVQGPLSASLLLDLVRTELPDVEVEHYDYRAVRPLIDGNPFQIQGCKTDDGLSLWVVDHEGAMTMQAKAILKA